MALRAIGPVLALLLVSACEHSTLERRSGPETFTLVPTESTIWFIGTKNNAVAVPGWFTGLQGQIDRVHETGWVEVTVGTLDTGDEARNQSIVTHLFGGADHPTARLDIQGEAGATRLPDVGENVEIQVKGTLSVRGEKTPLTVRTRLTHEPGNRIRVTTLGPFILTKEQLKLEKAFDVLKAVCGHASLSGSVPVQVDLVFKGS